MDSHPGRRRLSSWKEIGAYIGRDQRTAQRWETEGMPVHRRPHARRASVFAYTDELDAWLESQPRTADPPEAPSPEPSPSRRPFPRLSRRILVGVGLSAVIVAGAAWSIQKVAGYLRGVRCVESSVVDFDDGTFGPFLVPYGSTGSVSTENGLLVLSKDDRIGAPAVTMKGTGYALCGDFDVSVDFELTDFRVPSEGSRWTGVYLFTLDGKHYAAAQRFNRFGAGDCVPAVSNYGFYTIMPYACASTFVPTDDRSGKLRIKRTGEALTFYYWNGSWILAKEATGTRVPVLLALATASDWPTAQETRFDNLTVELGNEVSGPVTRVEP